MLLEIINKTNIRKMEFIVFLLIGALAGYLAGQLMGRSDSLLINILIGIVGGMIGGWLFGGLFSGLPTLGPISLGGIITATLGSCVLLWIIGLLKK